MLCRYLDTSNKSTLKAGEYMKKLYTQPNIEFINLILATDVLSTSAPEDNVGDIWGDGDDLFGDDFFEDDFETATESPLPGYGGDMGDF